MQMPPDKYRKLHFWSPRSVLLFLITCFALFEIFGCAATETADKGPSKISLLNKWSGDYPVSLLDRLPAGQQDSAVGYIGDIETFVPIWRAFMPTEILPAVDFNKYFVVYTRNISFYNQKSILSITLDDDTAEIIALETMSSRPIENQAAMAMAVIPRAGIRIIKSGVELIEVKNYQ